MSTMKFCRECNNILYPKESKEQKSLLYACRNCDHQIYFLEHTSFLQPILVGARPHFLRWDNNLFFFVTQVAQIFDGLEDEQFFDSFQDIYVTEEPLCTEEATQRMYPTHPTIPPLKTLPVSTVISPIYLASPVPPVTHLSDTPKQAAHPSSKEEEADNNCVYRNEIHHLIGERTQVLQDVAADPTLPRTKSVRCAVCNHPEAVFFQATARGEEGMTLFFVCCNPTCGHRWRD